MTTLIFPPRPGCFNRTSFRVEPDVSRRIVKASDAQVILAVMDESTGRPQDLTGFEAATGFFQGTAGDVAVSGSCPVPGNGEVIFNLPRDVTALLEAGEEMSWEAVVDANSSRNIIQFEGELTVYERLLGGE